METSQASQISGYFCMYYYFKIIIDPLLLIRFSRIFEKMKGLRFLNPIPTLSTGMISAINSITCERLSIDVVSMGFHRQASRNDYVAKGPVLLRVASCVLMQDRVSWPEPKK